MKASIITGVEGDDRLLRSEILAIIDIMSTRLKTKSLHPHVVAPVRRPGFSDEIWWIDNHAARCSCIP